MNPLPLGLLSSAILLVAWFLTGRLRGYAINRRVLDIPNPRSSHSVATPRGGGVSIVIATLVGLLVAGFLGSLPWPHVVGLMGSGSLVAAVGFIDDHRAIRRRWRLLAHFAAAAWVLCYLGGLPPLEIMGSVINPGWIGQAFALLYVVWVLNLTNFMDGIDGIAAVEVITVAAGGILLYFVVSANASQWTACVVLAAATLGFLPWNWPPAKIFMGDAGSGFLGLMLAALSVQAAGTDATLFWCWIILLGVFVVDATMTLTRRVLRGERIHEAHRTHAYQHAAMRWRGHRTVTLAVAAINLCWLLPLALAVARHSLDGLIGVAVAYTPLIALAAWIGAGSPAVTLEPPPPVLAEPNTTPTNS